MRAQCKAEIVKLPLVSVDAAAVAAASGVGRGNSDIQWSVCGGAAMLEHPVTFETQKSRLTTQKIEAGYPSVILESWRFDSLLNFMPQPKQGNNLS